MPPHVPRKRLRGSPDRQSAQLVNESTVAPAKRRKPTLYDDLDATATPNSGASSASAFQNLGDDDGDGGGSSSSNSSSSLTSLSDEDFEDVVGEGFAGRDKVAGGGEAFADRHKAAASEESEDEDEDFEFEDVEAPDDAANTTTVPVVSGDLELTLNKDTRLSLTNVYGDKKGPSKRERQVRNATHCMHVMLLLWHNAVRNSWLCDAQVQAMMLSHVPLKMWDEIERWRMSSGLVKASANEGKSSKNGRSGAKGKRKQQRASRDWGDAAERLEDGAVDMSHGDPLFRLMQSLTSWWKQRFRITRSGLRKWGYMALERLDRLTKEYREQFADQERFGERIASLDEFRRCAASCRGSRDVGAQLFTALLRGLGIEARMVASLQPLGFGWNRFEDADPEESITAESSSKPEEVKKVTSKKTPSKKKKPTARSAAASTPRPKRDARSKAETKLAAEQKDDLKPEHTDTDDESVVNLEVSPTKSKANPAQRTHDIDLDYPHYWTEVLSPVTKRYLSVDAIVKSLIATNRELVEAFEPRGQKADKARQVIAYVVGYSPDGTAKDVTVRYLKKQVVPGRTKGVRMPVEKIPVYNRHGKVKGSNEFDWFKSAMSGYRRGSKSHPITELDDDEDSTDLKAAKPEKREVKEGEETLQYYKQSKEFVLLRHLKREEALKPGAAAVRKFKNKAKGSKMEEEDVFLRSDLVQVKSAETWHKQGRAPLAGERPLKRVPYRAATLNRRREILEAEATTGEKVMQGLFSYDQTDWIIPPPIQNGVIPKNEYGNIDLFAEHMCPEGAVHVPYRGVVKVCKRLKIDFAEAVVDFEFGHRMAVPVIHGAVIAEEHHDVVMAELEKDEKERKRKEDEKRRKAALGNWRKFLMGLRIVARIRQDYGEIDDNTVVFGNSKVVSAGQSAAAPEKDEEMAGGFLPEGHEDEDEDEDGADARPHHTSSFFPGGDDEADDAADDDDLLTVEHE